MMRPIDNSPVSCQAAFQRGVCLLWNWLSLPQHHCTGSTWLQPVVPELGGVGGGGGR